MSAISLLGFGNQGDPTVFSNDLKNPLVGEKVGRLHLDKSCFHTFNLCMDFFSVHKIYVAVCMHVSEERGRIIIGFANAQGGLRKTGANAKNLLKRA